MSDVAAANPSIDILEIRQNADNLASANPRNRSETWLEDPFHLNDVEPLPGSIADRFESFEAGDLLLSARSLNLVFVVDPETLRIKWSRSGAWRRQHDPDWEPTGEISVFDNRLSRDYSRIVAVRPSTQETRTLLDGKTYNFYSRIRGKHQITAAKNLLITSAQQGRVFELDATGKEVLEIINAKPGSGNYNYPISEAIWFPIEAFNFAKESSCQN